MASGIHLLSIGDGPNATSGCNLRKWHERTRDGGLLRGSQLLRRVWQRGRLHDTSGLATSLFSISFRQLGMLSPDVSGDPSCPATTARHRAPPAIVPIAGFKWQWPFGREFACDL